MLARRSDGDALLDASKQTSPAEVHGVELVGHNLCGIAVEDTPFFVSLSSLDLSDNEIPFAQLAAFPALRYLTLQCNHLRRIAAAADGGFPVLQKLDLASNNLDAADIETLGKSVGTTLEELDVSANGLVALPPMGRFTALKRLLLSRNRLSGDELWANIALAYSVTHLNLDSNGVESINPLVRAAVNAADAKLVSASGSAYRGPWTYLENLSLADNHISDVGGMDVLLALPSLAELVLRGNPAFAGKSTQDVDALQRIYEAASPPVQLVLGAKSLFEPDLAPPMVKAYAAAAAHHSLVQVEETVQQSRFAIVDDPDLWRILDSDSDEDVALNSPKQQQEDEPAVALPARYELDDDGNYRTPADMRAAYAQLRHALAHPHGFERQPRPKRPPKGGGGRGIADVRALRHAQPARQQKSFSNQNPVASDAEPSTIEAERLASMEATLARMKERAEAMENDLGSAAAAAAAAAVTPA